MSTLRVDTILGESGAERRGLMTYALICDKKDSTTAGGTFTSGAWRTRDLNTKIADPDNIVTIPASNDQFTLQAGSYLIEANAPGYHVNRHTLRIQNITAGTTVQVGQTVYANATNTVANNSFVVARVTITGSTVFEIQHRSQSNHANNGMGVQTEINGVDSIYTTVKIYKEA